MKLIDKVSLNIFFNNEKNEARDIDNKNAKADNE